MLKTYNYNEEPKTTILRHDHMLKPIKYCINFRASKRKINQKHGTSFAL